MCLVPDSTPLRIGQSLFRTTQIVRGMESVDLCLLVSTTNSMSDSQIWLQVAVPVLNGHLLTLGIGTGERRNRYCLVTFGGNSVTRFIRVNGEIFFPYNQFFQARRQLRGTSGDSSDGYEAIDFTITTLHLESTQRGKGRRLVTDSDRMSPPARSNLTRETVYQALFSRHFLLDTVVAISLQLAEQSDRTVLGFHGYSKASILRPDGGYEMSQNQSVHSRSQPGRQFLITSLSLWRWRAPPGRWVSLTTKTTTLFCRLPMPSPTCTGCTRLCLWRCVRSAGVRRARGSPAINHLIRTSVSASPQEHPLRYIIHTPMYTTLSVSKPTHYIMGTPSLGYPKSTLCWSWSVL